MAVVPPEIQQKIRQLQSHIRQANSLEQAGRIDEAQAGYQACLQMVAHERMPLIDGQLVQIWTGIGFCYADRNDWHRALEWYHRAEAVLLSSPVFNSGPKMPESQANAKKWSSHLPEGVTVIFRQNYPAEAHLAELCDSIALAYDNDNQLEQAKAYYHRAIELHIKLGNPEREVEVWWHQALGYQRRQQWFDLEQAAERMLQVAERIQAKLYMLTARRFLAQSQVNQNRPFKTLEYLSQAVELGRELQDARLAVDEDLLRDLVQNMRPGVLQRGQADLLEPLVHAETVLNDPNLAQDKAILQQWQQTRPNTAQSGTMPVGELTSLSTVAMMLEHFALRHCGASTQTEKRTNKGLMARLNGPTEVVERRIWTITQEEMQVFQKDDHGQLTRGTATCAVLTLFGQPEVIINVSLTSSECNVMVMEERTLADVNQSGFFSTVQESIPAQSELLLRCLNSFIQRGLFVKTPRGLQYVSPKSP